MGVKLAAQCACKCANAGLLWVKIIANFCIGALANQGRMATNFINTGADNCFTTIALIRRQEPDQSAAPVI